MCDVETLHQRYVDAWNRHDPRAVAARYGSDGRYEPLPMEQSYAGEELVRFVRMVMDAFPDLTLRVLRRIAIDPLVIAEWEIGGTHVGEFMGAAPTGEYAIVRGCDIAEYAPDGTIRNNHVYWDSMTVARQIGLVPQEPRREELNGHSGGGLTPRSGGLKSG
jgi:steroid delta-isomerase-like uncharacterized protein